MAPASSRRKKKAGPGIVGIKLDGTQVDWPVLKCDAQDSCLATWLAIGIRLRRRRDAAVAGQKTIRARSNWRNRESGLKPAVEAVAARIVRS